MRQSAGSTRKARLDSSLRARLTLIGQKLRDDRRVWWIGAAALVVLGVGLVWTLWPAPAAEPPRARQYLDFTACLLTGEQGIADAAAAPAWAGLQDASLATHAKVQYLAVTGPQTVENATPFLASLAQAGCNLVFAAGDVPVAAIDQHHKEFPAVRFFPVGGGLPQSNVSPVLGQAPDEIRAAVDGVLTRAVAADGSSQ